MIVLNIFDTGRAATARERLAAVRAYARRCGFRIVGEREIARMTTADTMPAPDGAKRTARLRPATRRRRPGDSDGFLIGARP